MSRHEIIRSKFPVPVVHGEVARDWAKRRFSCDLFIDPPGRQWSNFVHACNELVTVIEGELELEMDEQAFVLHLGDEALIPRETNHSVRNTYRGTTRWLYGYD